MNFLVYKIAEHFGKELLKTVAIVVATTVATEAALKIADKLMPAEAAPMPQDGGETVDLSQLFSQPEAPKQAPVKVVVNVNSYNEKNTTHEEGNVTQEGNTNVGSPDMIEQVEEEDGDN